MALAFVNAPPGHFAEIAWQSHRAHPQPRLCLDLDLDLVDRAADDGGTSGGH
jgi:hypothetical protein